MSPVPPFAGKPRSYLEFLAAIIYYFLARSVARRAAFRLATDNWTPLIEQAILLLLLLAIFAAFGRLFDRESSPVSAQGLPLRSGWMREIGLGLTVGWGAAIACVIPLVLFGGIAIVLSTGRSSWIALLTDLLFFAVATLAEEVAFRGYGFQRFLSVVGPVGATLGFAAFYALLQALLPGSSKLSIAIAAIFSVVLTVTYLRTRALWVSWGLNFGWKASRALLFGLAVSGVSSHSSVIEGDPMGSFWLTGGGFGLDGSWIALFVFLLLLPVVYRVTRNLDFQHNAPVIVAAGLAVDLDASARSQHEAAMGPAQPSAPSLVQILPVTAQPASNLPENGRTGETR